MGRPRRGGRGGSGKAHKGVGEAEEGRPRRGGGGGSGEAQERGGGGSGEALGGLADRGWLSCGNVVATWSNVVVQLWRCVGLAVTM